MWTPVLRSICVSIKPISTAYYMQFRDRSIFPFDRLALVSLFFAPLLVVGATVLSLPAVAQTVPAATPAPPAPALVLGSTWTSLAKEQQTALAPLNKHWSGLSEGQKRKWLAVANTYPQLSAGDKEKLHSRMVEWAALSPKDREQARLNFAQTKSVGKADRAANWEAYQALSPEERKKLAEGAKAKPVGAAVAVKPVAPNKLATVPVTRHSPAAERAAAASQTPLNRSTLLPQIAPAPKSASAADGATQSTTAKP